MYKLSGEKRAQILALLVEGNSLRAASRISDTAFNTVAKLFVDAGRACADYQDRTLRNLHCKRLQLDEIWCFVYAKQKNVPTAKSAPVDAGDVWTWVAIDADTKLVPSWRIGDRSSETAIAFADDLAGRLANRAQITSDGHRAYLEAIEGAFGGDVDYAMLVKLYGPSPEGARRYSPAECVGARKEAIQCNPYVDGPLLTRPGRMFRSDRLRPYVRSVDAAAYGRCQDGFRDASSKQSGDHWRPLGCTECLASG